MSRDFSYDPVTAQSEASATGDLAAIYSDIRETMKIPILTSIWRGLASYEHGVLNCWQFVKPMYRDNIPQIVLDQVLASTNFCMLQKSSSQYKCLGLNNGDIQDIKNIIRSYNRSNGLNLITMYALVSDHGPSNHTVNGNTTDVFVKEIPPLLEKKEIPVHVWSMVRDINVFGTELGIHSHVATLWRHLAHWPAFLALAYTALLPHHLNNDLRRISKELIRNVKYNSTRIDTSHCDFQLLPGPVRSIISDYVTIPEQVARMVVLGNIMQLWVDR